MLRLQGPGSRYTKRIWQSLKKRRDESGRKCAECGKMSSRRRNHDRSRFVPLPAAASVRLASCIYMTCVICWQVLDIVHRRAVKRSNPASKKQQLPGSRERLAKKLCINPVAWKGSTQKRLQVKLCSDHNCVDSVSMEHNF